MLYSVIFSSHIWYLKVQFISITNLIHPRGFLVWRSRYFYYFYHYHHYYHDAALVFLLTVFYLFLVPILVAVIITSFLIGDSEMTEETSRKCIEDANKKFASLTRNIYSLDTFYGSINNLKCLYVSGWFWEFLNARLQRQNKN